MSVQYKVLTLTLPISCFLLTPLAAVGAGKTFFLSCLVCTFIQLHALSDQRDKPFAVLITSATNSAIETCLEAVASRLAQMQSTVLVAKIARADETEKPWMQQHSIRLLKQSDAKAAFFAKLPTASCVLGSTPWRLSGCKFATEGAQPFQLMIIDEASQIPVPHAALAIRYLDSQGRLICAGDHKQLPPIVKGSYPAATHGALKHYGSFLESLMRDTAATHEVKPFEAQPDAVADGVDTAQPFISKLRENFRMNASLAAFTQLTYGQDYVSQHPDYALVLDAARTQAVELSGSAAQQTAIRHIMLDSAASLNVLSITVTDSATLSKEQMASIDAVLVGDTFKLFAAGSSYSSPDAMAKQIIIVTPHHTRRRAVKQQLNAIAVQCGVPAARLVLVDTVEKAQGRTADLVVLCYGTFNETELQRDCNFMFDPSRLNVSLSRARAKVVMLIGACALHVPAQFIGDVRTQKGYKLFMQAVAHSKAEQGYSELVIEI